jgi:hypothetical protein
MSYAGVSGRCRDLLLVAVAAVVPYRSRSHVSREV